MNSKMWCEARRIWNRNANQCGSSASVRPPPRVRFELDHVRVLPIEALAPDGAHFLEVVLQDLALELDALRKKWVRGREAREVLEEAPFFPRETPGAHIQ